jgi:hypothetical protein
VKSKLLIAVTCCAATLVLATVGHASNSSVVFKSAEARTVFVKVHPGTGPCARRGASQTISVASGTSLEIGAGTGTLCYVYSFLADPEAAPFGGGEAKAGDEVTLLGIVFGRNELPFAPPAPSKDATAKMAIWSADPDAISREEMLGGRKSAVYERSLATWVDPLTPPQSKTDCINMARGDIPFDGEWKTCVEWRTSWRCMRREAVLVVGMGDGPDPKVLCEECLQTAAVAGTLSAVLGSPGSGFAAFVETLKACLLAKAGENLLRVDVENRGGWTDWGGC